MTDIDINRLLLGLIVLAVMAALYKYKDDQ